MLLLLLLCMVTSHLLDLLLVVDVDVTPCEAAAKE
jgi:hypothetical protein